MRAARGSQARQVLPKEAPRCGGGAKPRRRGHAQGARAPAEQRQEETNKKGHKHSLFALRADFLHLIRAERQQLWCTERTITSREASAGSPPSPIRQARPITRSKVTNLANGLDPTLRVGTLRVVERARRQMAHRKTLRQKVPTCQGAPGCPAHARKHSEKGGGDRTGGVSGAEVELQGAQGHTKKQAQIPRFSTLSYSFWTG
ncbi:unnamed protein product [Prorocentrum cordatum]|uniref:Uncharacterized protein n=1 Tax=Prorocentrum cordatum TaxID=2364126 RepID=A0ABN9QFL4_9DINO|nr:unnamed protein product [Polarella glacialis]